MLWSGLILGLVSSAHCLGMCGPIVFLLPVDRHNKVKAGVQVGSYHLGRIFAYFLIGSLLGFLGKGFSLLGLQQYLSIGLGVVILVIVLLPATSKYLKINIAGYHRFLSKIKSQIGKNLKKKTLDTFLSLGFLNGFLPCGMVYIAVFTSLTFNSFWHSGLFMILFGLGTVPLMTTVVFVQGAIGPAFKKRLQKAAPLVLGIMACLLIVRGMGLGIPYLSPANQMATVESAMDCHTPNEASTLEQTQ